MSQHTPSANIMLPFTVSWLDYPDNHSQCVSVYLMGCDNFCTECFNASFQDIDYPKETQWLSVSETLPLLEKALITHQTNKVCLLGGDPLYKKNIAFTKILLKELHKKK